MKTPLKSGNLAGNPEPTNPGCGLGGGVETVVATRSEIKGVIAGMVLGDGCVFFPKAGKNAYLRIQHGERQRDYLLYKATLLQELTGVTVTEIGGKYPGLALRTASHPLFTRLRRLAYPTGTKTVSKTWLTWLTPQGLAIWYMDDGSISKQFSVNKSGRRRISRREVCLATCGFSYSDHKLLVEFIKERFGLEAKIKRDGRYFRLRFGAVEANKLFDIIRPYVIPSLAYKLDMQYEPKQPNVEQPTSLAEEPVRSLQGCKEGHRNDGPTPATPAE